MERLAQKSVQEILASYNANAPLAEATQFPRRGIPTRESLTSSGSTCSRAPGNLPHGSSRLKIQDNMSPPR